MSPSLSIINYPHTVSNIKSIRVNTGSTIEDLATYAPTISVCRVNGGPDYVLREDWPNVVLSDDDVVEFIEYPQIEYALYAAVAFLAYSAYQYSRIKKVNALDTKRESVYNTSLSGNVAKPDAPVSKICGRCRVQPPFAHTPYTEYSANGDQYYYALLAIGVGNHVLERDLIDDTPIGHFADVLVRQYLPPGQAPSQVQANVINSPEISGQDMLTGRYIGAFSACGPGFTVKHLGIDIVAPRGLASQQSDGSMSNLSTSWVVSYRTVDGFGQPTSIWTNFPAESRTANVIKAQRWSTKYTLPVPARIEVRIVRTDTKSTNSGDAHDIIWDGMRAYLDQPAPLNPNVAHYEVVMRASEQLNAVSQKSLTLYIYGMCRTLTPTLTWGPEVATRNPAWWILDLATSSVWGLGESDDRIDLQSFYEYSLVWDERQDRFDYEFSDTDDAWTAMQLIATAGRAKVFRRNGVLSIARDELALIPVTAFSPRNTTPSSMVMEEVLPTRDMPDGYVIEFLSNRTWLWTSIDCPCPGVTTMQRPLYVKLQGITGFYQAKREGLYMAAKLLYRRRNVQCTTEMQGLLPAYMAPVKWMAETLDYGQSGDVLSYLISTRTAILSEKPVWNSGTSYITLIRDDGSVTSPIVVLAGSTPNEVILQTDPDFVLICDDHRREKPKFMFGTASIGVETVRVESITDAGDEDGVPLIGISGVVEDIRIHSADEAFLPVDEDDIQDPIYVPDEDSGGGGEGSNPELYVVTLSNQFISTYALVNEAGTYTLQSNGQANATPNIGNIPNQWLWSTVSPSIAALYEVRATDVSGGGSGTFNTWLSLGTDRSWTYIPGVDTTLGAYIEIRDVATQTLQAAATISFIGYGSGNIGDGGA
jgi:hypothetical protein